MAEGSDGSGSGMELGQGGGSCGNWSVGRKKKRKKNLHDKTDDSDCDARVTVLFKLTQKGDSFEDWNPIKLTKYINKEIGEVRSAKVLRNGSLLVICKDGGQQGNQN